MNLTLISLQGHDEEQEDIIFWLKSNIIFLTGFLVIPFLRILKPRFPRQPIYHPVILRIEMGEDGHRVILPSKSSEVLARPENKQDIF